MKPTENTKDVSQNKHSGELLKLDKKIALVTWAIVLIIASALTVYTVWFGYWLNSGVSESGAAWGTFGDYFGGLLNPIISSTALYWLLQSVRLQKTELHETRSALQESATAQRDQVAVASWTALINANTAQTQHLQYQLSQVMQRIASVNQSGRLYKDELSKLGTEKLPIETELAERAASGRRYEQKLSELIEKLPGT